MLWMFHFRPAALFVDVQKGVFQMESDLLLVRFSGVVPVSQHNWSADCGGGDDSFVCGLGGWTGLLCEC